MMGLLRNVNDCRVALQHIVALLQGGALSQILSELVKLNETGTAILVLVKKFDTDDIVGIEVKQD